MASPRRFELDDLIHRPGTYFNPQTEVLLVVDDSTEIDSEIFAADDAAEGDGETEWVLISDEVAIDEHTRDDLIERFQARHHPEVTGAVAADEDDVEEVDELEPDEDEDDDVAGLDDDDPYGGGGGGFDDPDDDFDEDDDF